MVMMVRMMMETMVMMRMVMMMITKIFFDDAKVNDIGEVSDDVSDNEDSFNKETDFDRKFFQVWTILREHQ